MNEDGFISYARSYYYCCKDERRLYGEEFLTLQFNDYLTENFYWLFPKYWDESIKAF